jgi:hypothetical protein
MQRQTRQTKQNDQTKKIAQIDCQLFSLEQYQETDAKVSQKHGFIRYDNQITYFQTPELVLRTYGIPKFNEQYHKDEESRSYIKIPLDESQAGGKLMLEKFRELDEYFKGKQEALFGKNASSYEYKSLVKEPQLDEESEMEDKKEDTKSKYPPLPKLPFLKAKFDLDYTTKALKTKLSLVDDQGEVTEPVVQHLDDIAQHVRLNSEYRLVLAFSKHWAQKKAISGKKLWGITLKVRRVRVKARPVVQKTGPQDDFLDSDSEESEVKQFTKAKPVQSKVVQETTEVAEVVEEPEEQEAEEAEELETGEVEDELEEEPDLEVPAPRKPVMTKKEDSPKKGKTIAKGKTTGKKSSKLDV